MSIFVLGINHKTAPVELREKLAFDAAQLPAALGDVRAATGVDEAVIVSTCNRTEVWAAAGSDRLQSMRDWLAARRPLGAPLDHCLYGYRDDDAVRHLYRVACGLDSLVLGEPQVLGQLKDAYRQALAAGTAGASLSRAFQHAFSVAKQVRTDTGIGASPVSVAFAAVTLARQIFSDFERHTALLVGAGDTIELTARHLRTQRIGRLLVANRTIEHAQALADRFDAVALGLDALDSFIADADIIVTATASAHPLLTRAQMERALAVRRHRPVFIVDVAVPRDVDAAVGELEDVYLYTVDDLRHVVDDGLRARRAAAGDAERIIELAVAHFASVSRARDADDVIRGLRGAAERARDETLAEASRMLVRGDDPDAVLRWVGHTLTNRLIHDPTVRLRDAGLGGDAETLAAARRALGLE